MKQTEYIRICALISSRLSGGSRAADLQLLSMRRLMLACDNPQDKVPAVHIAGTNGKGSTAAYSYNIARAAGLRTGLFISPHLERFNERIVVDGREIADVDFVRLAQTVLTLTDSLQLQLSGFALLTAMAFLYFVEQDCALMVVETGLGGRFDATNVIAAPLVSVLTAIDYDHVKLLGESLAEIAAEKCGIIKPNCPVVALRQTGVVNSIIESAARSNNSWLQWCDRADIAVSAQGLDGLQFSYQNYADLKIALVGDYQLTNAVTALLAIAAVNQSGELVIGDDAIRSGLLATRWPGRLEVFVLPDHVLIIDGAHNPHGAGSLANFIKSQFSCKVALIFGSLRTKDTGGVIQALIPVTSRAYTINIDNPLALSAATLQELFVKNGIVTTACSSMAAALTAALANQRVIVICGSLYLVAEARRLALKLKLKAES